MPVARVRVLALLVLALSLVGLRSSAAHWLAPPVPVRRAASVPTAPESAAAARLRRGEPIDLNTATADDLALLPRVGPALAARIVADRNARGPFRELADLVRVPGVGPRTLARIAHLVVVRTADQRSKISP